MLYKLLDCVTPISLMVLRLSFLFRWLIRSELAITATSSLKRLEYRMMAKSDLEVFFGKFKITANMLGQKLIFINSLILGFIVGDIVRFYLDVIEEILH